MKQLYIAFGIPCIILLIFISILNVSDGIIDSFSEYVESIKPMIYLTLGFLAAPIPIIFIFFKNKYPFSYEIDNKCAVMSTRKEQRKRNNIVSSLLIFLGLLTGKPGAVGAGLLSGSNQGTAINLSDVKVMVFELF